MPPSLTLLAVLAVVAWPLACGGRELTGSVVVSGSSTVEPITIRVAELFNDREPTIDMLVDGPGTGDGFELFCNGETDINDASSRIEPEQLEECAANGVEPIELPIGNDGIAVMTSAGNDSVDWLALEDLYALVGPESQGVDRWSAANGLARELGGRDRLPDLRLDVIGPGEESGTFVSFVELVQPLFHQRWRIPGAETALTEKDTNWKEFLCYAPQVPFNARHYREFRLFWPYSTGIFCQWMSHIIDLVNLVLGERPKAVVAAGGTYVWNDGRTNPDTAHCLVEYPSGCLMSYHMRLGNGAHARPLTFYGTNGTLDLDAGVAYGDGGGGEVILANPGSLIPELIVDASRRLPDRHQGATILDAEPDGDHMVDFFRAVRTRCPTRAGVDAAFNHALATTMAGMSWRLGARIEYDPIADSLNVGEPRKR